MTFQDITVREVLVEPGPSADSFRLQFQLSRIPERFWPECFMSAYNVQTNLRRMDLTEDRLQITLPEAEAPAYATVVQQTVQRANAAYQAEQARRVAEQQARLDGEQQRQARAATLQQQLKQTLGI